jgi:ubiquinone/menaquinone biosynthesis C-methylase UbiE
MSNVGKILVWVMIFFIVVHLLNQNLNTQKYLEGFQQDNDFLFLEDDKVYDDFYSKIYDNLVYSDIKNDYEVGAIVNKTNPTRESIILDVGSGTGKHVAQLSDMSLNVLGIDKSQAMVNRAKETYPNYNFMVGDILNATTFQPESFTHIFCLYFTIYYMKNKQQFFNNCYNFLMPGGFLAVHLVDRENFDPILPPSNPLLLISPQRYAKERITKSKVVFKDFNYEGDFQLETEKNKAQFIEKFTSKDGKKVRKQQHNMVMERIEDIIQMAQFSGFVVLSQIDLLQVQYQYQYVYVFQKPE